MERIPDEGKDELAQRRRELDRRFAEEIMAGDTMVFKDEPLKEDGQEKLNNVVGIETGKRGRRKDLT